MRREVGFGANFMDFLRTFYGILWTFYGIYAGFYGNFYGRRMPLWKILRTFYAFMQVFMENFTNLWDFYGKSFENPF